MQTLSNDIQSHLQAKILYSKSYTLYPTVIITPSYHTRRRDTHELSIISFTLSPDVTICLKRTAQNAYRAVIKITLPRH